MTTRVMNRRTALKLGAGVGVAGGAGLLGYEVVPPSPSAQLERVDALARELFTTLDAEQRGDACVPYDHPLRQYHNRGVWGGGREVLFGFSRRQRRILTDVMYAGLSAEGRSRVPDEYFTRWSGVHGMRVLICGDPTAPFDFAQGEPVDFAQGKPFDFAQGKPVDSGQGRSPYQIIMTGAHLNLRLGGRSREGAAFGGPQVYGDQRGNEQVGLPGNMYRDQFVLAQTLLHGLDPKHQQRAVLADAPVQTGIELQGRHGVFPGLAVAELDSDRKAVVNALVERVLATYPADDVTYARACLQANGGVDGLFVSYYERGEDGTIPDAQVFRLEGPGAVLYFRGYPHVHAFVNIAMDGDAPLSSGELLSDNPSWLDRAGVKKLFEAAMRMETGADLAYYPEGSVAGRLRPGPIRSGDIYTLESWQEPVEVGQIHGSMFDANTFGPLANPVLTLDPTRTYTIASTDYGLDRVKEQFGRVESPTPRGLLRDLTIAHVKARGFLA